MSAVAQRIDYFEDEFAEFERIRGETLQRLVKTLHSFPADSGREEFARLFAGAQKVLECDDTELAKTFKVSRPTIGRWARGDAAPHPLGRASLFAALIDIAEAKLKYHPSDASRRAATVR